jgi:hypothetical protein
MWIRARHLEPAYVTPLASRLVSGNWWAVVGFHPGYVQPLPAALSRPAHLAPGAVALPPHGRHRRVEGLAQSGEGLLYG